MNQDSTTWEAAIVRGLRMAVAESLGTHAPFSLDDKVLDFVEAAADLEEMELFPSNVAERFGIDPNDATWKQLWGYDAQKIDWLIPVMEALTFQAIVDHLVLRVTPLKERLDIILGKRCRQAGAFRNIETMATMVDPQVGRFKPSDEISKTMGRRLRPFWAQLRWRTGADIPELPVSRILELTVFGILVMFVSFIALGALTYFGKVKFDVGMSDAQFSNALLIITLATISLVLGTIAVTLVVRLISGKGRKTPTGIRTFGDLSRIITPDD